MNIKALKKAMEKNNIGQRELSRASGVSLSSINLAINGKTKNVTSNTITALEKALKLKKGTLL